MARSPAPPPRRSSGIGYLILAILAAAVFAAVALAPASLRNLVGARALPVQEGEPPQVVSTVQVAEGADRSGAAEVDFAPRSFSTAPAAAPTARVAAPDAGAGTAARSGGETKLAEEALAKAQADFRAMRWSEAAAAARRAAAYDAAPLVKMRAADLAANAALVGELFARLGERDELTRAWDTHPSLLRLTRNGASTLAVPLEGDGEPPVPVAEDPVGFVERMRRKGPVAFMYQGGKDFILSQQEDRSIGEVAAVDVAAVIRNRALELDSRIGRLRMSDRARDPTEWYELGRYAYRNRIDGKVAELLDRAVTLEPNLARRVREEKAALLAAQMLIHLRSGNKLLAAPFKVQIQKLYSDTDEGKQAIAQYDDRQEEMLRLAKAAAEDNRRREAERSRQLADKAEAARRAGDEARATELTAAATATDEPAMPAASAAPVSGDEAKADELKTKVTGILKQAVSMPATPERNKLYHEAVGICDQARAIYTRLINGGKAGPETETKLIEVSKMRFLAHKSQTL